ncbi:WS/DGAT domain-containing protein [Nannocystis pusilla]|uniref:WSD1 family O-acyltransferase n=1 Tax=Nannocystis pusilla TaxID=889268 RepID=A0ABS7TMN7_9BACT|nr:WS/DGAT domain-containing protein [Nannocystis pusilla]MBZ5709351.1 WSD1 family O-acyltransferase [Nannocystis pusilla]
MAARWRAQDSRPHFAADASDAANDRTRRELPLHGVAVGVDAQLFMNQVLPRLPRPPVNLVISKVRGARETQYLVGSALDSVYLGGPLLEQIGLNLTVWSYRDTVHLAAVGCPDTIPDPRLLLAECEHALAELVVAVQRSGPECGHLVMSHE